MSYLLCYYPIIFSGIKYYFQLNDLYLNWGFHLKLKYLIFISLYDYFFINYAYYWDLISIELTQNCFYWKSNDIFWFYFLNHQYFFLKHLVTLLQNLALRCDYDVLPPQLYWLTLCGSFCF